MRLITKIASVGVVFTAMLASGVALATDSRPTPTTVGADGVGDPYFPQDGNGGYRVSHYDVTVTIDPGRPDQFTGDTLVNATATQDLDRFDLDLKGFDVTAVAVNGTPATAVARSGDHELVITPAHRVPRGSRLDVRVRYRGAPVGDGWHRLSGGGLSAAGEPHSATAWYPCNDHPSNKATFSLTATVPDGWTVIGNGLPGPTTHANGNTTFRWHESHPMATYASTIAVDKFTVHSSALADGTPVINAYGQNTTYRAESDALPAKMVQFLSAKFGPYPFESTGSIVLSGSAMGLETQTRPTYDGGLFDVAVVHELAHQWFGDSVSFTDWRDGCIAECFAQYTDMLLDAEVNGGDIDRSYREQVARAVNEPSFWSVALYDPGKNHPLASALYSKGSLMLHALRRTIGDDTFYRILREWLRRYRDANASWPDFETLAQTMSQQDLSGFFQAWAHSTTVPANQYLYPGRLPGPA
jgi:aminopeptidase N